MIPNLILTITNPQNGNLDQQTSKTFDQQGGVIGRSLASDWVLHDPNRFISSQHAAITFQDAEYFITDLSSNGVFINNSDSPLGKGNTVSFAQIQTLSIGEFIVSANVDSAPRDDLPPSLSPPPPSQTGLPTQEEPTPPPPFDASLKPNDFLTDYASRDPLDLLGVDSLQTPHDASASLPENLFGDGLNENKNERTFAHDYSVTPQIEDAYTPPNPSDLRDIPEQTPTIPENWDQTHFDPIDQVSEAQGAHQLQNEPAPQKTPPPLECPTHAEPPPYATPGFQAEKHPLPPSPARPSKGQSVMGQYPQAKAAFETNGLDPSLLEDPQFVDQSLTLIPEMLKGLMATLRSRAEIKNELRATRTMLQSTENNPIKFSAGLEDAISNLLLQQRPGFLSPTDSVQRAFEDLTQHEAALIAGIQSGLDGLLNKLSPATLVAQMEHKQGNKGLFGKINPAKKWQHYEQAYQKIAEDSNNSFIDMFGDDFLEGYETFIAHHKQPGN